MGCRGTLNGTKPGYWHGYHSRDRKLNYMMVTNTALITGLHANILIMTQVLKKGFHVASEVENLILKKIPPRFVLTRKWQTNPAKDL